MTEQPPEETPDPAPNPIGSGHGRRDGWHRPSPFADARFGGSGHYDFDDPDD